MRKEPGRSSSPQSARIQCRDRSGSTPWTTSQLTIPGLSHQLRPIPPRLPTRCGQTRPYRVSPAIGGLVPPPVRHDVPGTPAAMDRGRPDGFRPSSGFSGVAQRPPTGNPSVSHPQHHHSPPPRRNGPVGAIGAHLHRLRAWWLGFASPRPPASAHRYFDAEAKRPLPPG